MKLGNHSGELWILERSLENKRLQAPHANRKTQELRQRPSYFGHCLPWDTIIPDSQRQVREHRKITHGGSE
jgi:hypothetical protein